MTEGFIFFIAGGREPDLIDKLSRHLTLMLRVGYEDPPHGVEPIKMCADLITRILEGDVMYDSGTVIIVWLHEYDMLNMLCDQMVASGEADPRSAPDTIIEKDPSKTRALLSEVISEQSSEGDVQ